MRAGARRTVGVLAIAGALAAGATTAQAGPPPAINVVPPAITGVPLTGQTLTAYNGFWTRGGGNYIYSYSWQRCDLTGANCVATGGTAQTYVVQSADVGHTLRVRVGALGDNGNASTWSYATSAPTAPVAR
jgi:hypothetical protein